MWMRFKGLWWIKKVKWSADSSGNGTRAFTAVSPLLPNVCGGQVGVHVYPRRLKVFTELTPSKALAVCCWQAPCPQTTSCTMASPGLPSNWTNSAPSWKMCCPAQTPGSDLINGRNLAAAVMLPYRLIYWLKSDAWPAQIPGRREPGNGVFREAAYRRSAENQKEVERGQQRQTGAVLLQVNTATADMDMF